MFFRSWPILQKLSSVATQTTTNLMGGSTPESYTDVIATTDSLSTMLSQFWAPREQDGVYYHEGLSRYFKQLINAFCSAEAYSDLQTYPFDCTREFLLERLFLIAKIITTPEIIFERFIILIDDIRNKNEMVKFLIQRQTTLRREATQCPIFRDTCFIQESHDQINNRLKLDIIHFNRSRADKDAILIDQAVNSGILRWQRYFKSFDDACWVLLTNNIINFSLADKKEILSALFTGWIKQKQTIEEVFEFTGYLMEQRGYGHDEIREPKNNYEISRYQYKGKAISHTFATILSNARFHMLYLALVELLNNKPDKLTQLVSDGRYFHLVQGRINLLMPFKSDFDTAYEEAKKLSDTLKMLSEFDSKSEEMKAATALRDRCRI